MSEPGHNLLAGGQLKSIVERVERLAEEKAQITSDISDVYSEAKGNGYDVKVLRKVVALRKMDPAARSEQATIMETYLHALGDA